MSTLRTIQRSYWYTGTRRRDTSPMRILFGAFLAAVWLFGVTAGVVVLIGAPR